ncbi:MAG TPA: hypothetical protein VJ804_10455, partial [Acidimicrobiales bacterium]|nr:hypothetical protein [Acidimicrobiales bacterium]
MRDQGGRARRRRALASTAAVVTVVALLGMTAVAAAAPPPGGPALVKTPEVTFVVNSRTDPGVSGCTARECTFREAITAANNKPGADRITFDLENDLILQDMAIRPMAALPAVTGAVTIDGGTQPRHGFVAVAGLGAGEGVHGLRITGSDVTVRSLHVGGFDGYGVYITGDRNRVVLSTLGSLLANRLGGVAVVSSASVAGVYSLAEDNVIDDNVIAGNRCHGVRLEGAVRTTVSRNATGGSFFGP